MRISVPSRNLMQFKDKMARAIGQQDIPGLRWLLEGFNMYDLFANFPIFDEKINKSGIFTCSYDKERVKEVGPDRAAAEWIVRCEGSVKFDRIEDVFTDYNALIKRCAELDPRVPADDVRVVLIDATDSCVTGYGCKHFENLRGIQEVRFVRCRNLHDWGLEIMADHVGDRLQFLEIDSCPRITEFGIKHLHRCKALKSLLLANLKSVHGKDKVLGELEQALPNTKITSKL
ncbi:hypothetical protein WR25_25898 [Diploscapter pachys]|uniref:Uncharacterized protein n=1 Tax=Diploscapter pachys TaxID=2018661 RepID=A0A2A2L1X3_9BILA|nr:hypothetical protein WR25_25898 [Diploscapter pachys]